MSSILVASRGGVGPSLWRNYKWGWRYEDAAVVDANGCSMGAVRCSF